MLPSFSVPVMDWMLLMRQFIVIMFIWFVTAVKEDVSVQETAGHLAGYSVKSSFLKVLYVGESNHR
jgi:hypothetical protein